MVEEVKLYSTYMLDPEEGWHAVHRLPLHSAIRHGKEYRARYAGSVAALVPDHADPKPYLDFAIAVA